VSSENMLKHDWLNLQHQTSNDWTNFTTLNQSYGSGPLRIYNISFYSVLIGWPDYDESFWKIVIYNGANVGMPKIFNTFAYFFCMS